jgi:hypothetical protein
MKKELIIVLFILVINLVVCAFSENLPLCNQHDIITIDNNSSVHIKKIISNVSYGPNNCANFTFPTTWKVSNYKIYAIPSNESLPFKYTEKVDKFVIDVDTNSLDWVNSKPSYAIEFDLNDSIVKQQNNYLFQWNWGNTTFDLPLEYTFKINKKYQFIGNLFPSQNLLTYEDNYTQISIKGVAKKGEYFQSAILFENFGRPNIELTKQIENQGSIVPGDNVIVTLSIKNSGASKAINIKINPSIPDIFTYLEPPNTTVPDLDPQREYTITFRFKTLIESTKEIGADTAEYADVWGTNYSSNSVSPRITIKRDESIQLPFIGVSVPKDNALSIFLAFVSGYILFFCVLSLSPESANGRIKGYKEWESIKFFDKFLLSSVLGAINYFVAITLLFLTIAPFIILVFFSQKYHINLSIPPVFGDNWLYVYLIFAVFVTWSIVIEISKDISKHHICQRLRQLASNRILKILWVLIILNLLLLLLFAFFQK